MLLEVSHCFLKILQQVPPSSPKWNEVWYIGLYFCTHSYIDCHTTTQHYRHLGVLSSYFTFWITLVLVMQGFKKTHGSCGFGVLIGGYALKERQSDIKTLHSPHPLQRGMTPSGFTPSPPPPQLVKGPPRHDVRITSSLPWIATSAALSTFRWPQFKSAKVGMMK
jgi:hypothetical protein